MVEIYTVKTKITDYYFIMKETSHGIAVCRVNRKNGGCCMFATALVLFDRICVEVYCVFYLGRLAFFSCFFALSYAKKVNRKIMVMDEMVSSAEITI